MSRLNVGLDSHDARLGGLLNIEEHFPFQGRMHAPQKPTSAAEFEQALQQVQAVISNEQRRKELLKTYGNDAQEWLDLFQLLAEYPNVAMKLRSWIFKLMIRLSRASGLYPQCLTIRDVEKLGNHPVGGGAFGDVWKGRIGQQLVCLKVARAFEESDMKQIVKDYMQEAILWRQLDHPNLLPFMGVYYSDMEQKQLCLVSPWMEQGNLVQFLKNTARNLVDHDLLAYDVACGLLHLHEMNIVHGDLKGVNILVTPDLRACIADFGLSRVSATQLLLSETSRSKGTMRWLSPELLRPGPNCIPSKQSDVYAYACVCYEIFTGRIPFYELAEAAIVFAVLMDKQHPSRPEDSVKLRGSMWDMMVACWNEAPSARPTMVDVLARIYEMNADRRLEPASNWNDPAFTHIWNDVEHPPVAESTSSQRLVPLRSHRHEQGVYWQSHAGHPNLNQPLLYREISYLNRPGSRHSTRLSSSHSPSVPSVSNFNNGLFIPLDVDADNFERDSGQQFDLPNAQHVRGQMRRK